MEKSSLDILLNIFSSSSSFLHFTEEMKSEWVATVLLIFLLLFLFFLQSFTLKYIYIIMF